MILIYHHSSPKTALPENPDPSEGWQLVHSPEAFERHLRELDRRGWRFLSLPEMVRIIRDTGREPPKTVVITLDDGWCDNHDYALPVLRKLGRTATFILTTAHLHRGGGGGGTQENERGRSSESRRGGDDRRRAHANASRPGSNPRTTAQEEIEGCKVDLEGLLGRPVAFFAYTGGAFNRRVAEMTRQAGYQAACSVLGPAHNDRSSLFWLFRDLITEQMNKPGDLYRLSPLARRLIAWRVRRQLRRRLGETAPSNSSRAHHQGRFAADERSGT